VRIRTDSGRSALPRFRVFAYSVGCDLVVEPCGSQRLVVVRVVACGLDGQIVAAPNGGQQAISRLNAEASSVGSQLPTISENDGRARNR